MSSKTITMSNKTLFSQPGGDTEPSQLYSVENGNTGRSGPRWSMQSRHVSFPRECGYDTPAPKYLPSSEMGKEGRGVVFGSRPDICKMECSEKERIRLYLVENGNTGRRGPRWSLQSRHLSFPREPGYDAPAPKYLPNPDEGREGRGVPFGIRSEITQSECPGPNRYIVKNVNRGPKYSLGYWIPFPITLRDAKFTPGPGNYSLKTSMGKGPKAVMTTKVKEDEPETVLWMYRIPQGYNKGQFAASLKYRWFDNEVKKSPNAQTYSPTLVNKRRAPAYTISPRSKPYYPEIISYRDIVEEDEPTPGPAAYNIATSMATPRKTGAKSHVTPKRESTVKLPAPNQYIVLQTEGQKFTAAPHYTMAQAAKPPKDPIGPGPAAYALPSMDTFCRDAKKKKKAKSIQIKLPAQVGKDKPSPQGLTARDRIGPLILFATVREPVY